MVIRMKLYSIDKIDKSINVAKVLLGKSTNEGSEMNTKQCNM